MFCPLLQNTEVLVGRHYNRDTQVCVTSVTETLLELGKASRMWLVARYFETLRSRSAFGI